jgi:methionyl-tRNA formyltransferase
VRTVLITNGNLLSLLSLGDFLYRHHGSLESVYITTRLPSERSNVTGILRMFRKNGWRYTHFKLLTNLLLPRRIRRDGLPATIPQFLSRLDSNIRIVETPQINAPAIVDEIRQLKPEILLSFSALSRFEDALIETATRAAVNAHYALLPAYAGLSPYFWYLHQRERHCGVTFHQIISKLDAGPIIEQSEFSIEHMRTVMAVLLEQTAQVSPLLNRYFDGETSESRATPQDLSRRSYYRHPTRNQVREFHNAGYRFYDPQDIAQVFERVRELHARMP